MQDAQKRIAELAGPGAVGLAGLLAVGQLLNSGSFGFSPTGWLMALAPAAVLCSISLLAAPRPAPLALACLVGWISATSLPPESLPTFLPWLPLALSLAGGAFLLNVYWSSLGHTPWLAAARLESSGQENGSGSAPVHTGLSATEPVREEPEELLNVDGWREPTPDGEPVVQSWTRSFSGELERLEGMVRVRFEAGQSRCRLHIPLVPLFPGIPHGWCESDDDSTFSAEFDVLKPYGVRLTVRRRGDRSGAAETDLAILLETARRATRAA